MTKRGDAEFREKLAEQLRLLQRSCAGFYDGELSEAVRIAVIVRVLFHDTRHSVSLLKHLGAKDRVKVLSTYENDDAFAPLLGPGWRVLANSNGLASLRISYQGAQLRAPLADTPRRELVPVTNWWNEVVWSVGERQISRRSLVLTAANQDGGAHVDDELDKDYEAVARAGSSGTFIRDGNKVTYRMSVAFDTYTGQPVHSFPTDGEPLVDTHRHSLRQVGYEVLNSPDILSLAS